MWFIAGAVVSGVIALLAGSGAADEAKWVAENEVKKAKKTIIKAIFTGISFLITGIGLSIFLHGKVELVWFIIILSALTSLFALAMFFIFKKY